MAANKTEIPAFMEKEISDQVYSMYAKKAYDNGKFFLEWATRVLLYFIPSYDKSLESIFISASYMTKKLKNPWLIRQIDANLVSIFNSLKIETLVRWGVHTLTFSSSQLLYSCKI